MSREQFEKENLKKRREGFTRYPADVIDQPLAIQPSSQNGVYMSEHDRLHTDVAGEERRRRDAASRAQQQRLLQKRDSALAREEKRWEGMASETRKEEERLERKRTNGLAAKKNQPSLPFNPITLEYSNSYSGGMLQHHDDLTKWRSALRTQNLYTKQNGEFNPITGALRMDVTAPPKPQTPMR